MTLLLTKPPPSGHGPTTQTEQTAHGRDRGLRGRYRLPFASTTRGTKSILCVCHRMATGHLQMTNASPSHDIRHDVATTQYFGLALLGLALLGRAAGPSCTRGCEPIMQKGHSIPSGSCPKMNDADQCGRCPLRSSGVCLSGRRGECNMTVGQEGAGGQWDIAGRKGGGERKGDIGKCGSFLTLARLLDW